MPSSIFLIFENRMQGESEPVVAPAVVPAVVASSITVVSGDSIARNESGIPHVSPAPQLTLHWIFNEGEVKMFASPGDVLFESEFNRFYVLVGKSTKKNLNGSIGDDGEFNVSVVGEAVVISRSRSMFMKREEDQPAHDKDEVVNQEMVIQVHSKSVGVKLCYDEKYRLHISEFLLSNGESSARPLALLLPLNARLVAVNTTDVRTITCVTDLIPSQFPSARPISLTFQLNNQPPFLEAGDGELELNDNEIVDQNVNLNDATADVGRVDELVGGDNNNNNNNDAMEEEDDNNNATAMEEDNNVGSDPMEIDDDEEDNDEQEGNNEEDEDDPPVSLDDLLEADEETVKQVPVSNSARLRKGRAVGFCFGEQGEGWVRGIVKRGNNGGENSVRFQGVVVTCWVSVDGELFSLDLRKEKYLTEAEPMEEGAWVFIEKCGDGCL